MRILVAHSRYRSGTPSGENKVVDIEVEALRAAGHDVCLFERRSDDIAAWSAARKVAVPINSIWDRSARTELLSMVADRRPDVVHVHNTFPLLSASVLSACTDARVPAVVSIHNYRLACPGGLFYREGHLCHDCAGTMGLAGLRRGCYRGSPLQTAPIVVANAVQRRAWRTLPSAYVFVSAAEREALECLRLPPERQFVKWNLVPAPPLEHCPRSHQVIFMGRLDESKGLAVLMEGWERFRTGSVSGLLRLVIAGTGPMEDRVRAWAQHFDDVEVVGLLDARDCRRLAARSLAAVVPSVWQETFGLVAVEAMSNGLAVVGADIGAIAELIADGETGALFRAGDAAALATVLYDVAARPGRWRQMGEAARQLYEARFESTGNIAQLLEIYRFAIDNPAYAPR